MTESPGTEADVPPYRYTAAMADEIERRWQDRWERDGTFVTGDPRDGGAGDEKLYVMDMFPYPSGAGLHVGHPLGYIATDVFARFMRARGRHVLHPMGFDAFGLPAEQYAIQTGTHPRATTEANMARYRAQFRRLGLAHDPTRSIETTDPGFYRWTQWVFLQIFDAWYDDRAGRARHVEELVAAYADGTERTPDGRPWADLDEQERRTAVDARRLAYVADAPVNWCPALGTVLSDEEVTAEGRSERGNFPVFKRNLRQWMMRITAYADRLLADLDRVQWPEPVRLMQRNWIGRSHGARIDFPVADDAPVPARGTRIPVFTTRPDTVFGATFLVLAPEHPAVDDLVADAWPAEAAPGWTGGAGTPVEAVTAYREQAARRSEVERQSEGRDKTGIFTGSYATNPVNGERIPVFVADYVLMGYGTGAIMAVPGQDQRDWDFATAYALPIVRTVSPPAGWEGEAYLGEGPAVASGFLDGLGVDDAKARIVEWLAEHGYGEGTVTYKLRDWLFSRQRYWGEPFPVVFDDHGPIALPESMLPVELPDVDDYAPQTYAEDDAGSEPMPPLARRTDWVEVTLDLGDGPRKYRRETNTMPNWAGSSWYELRYLDPRNERAFVDPGLERYWMGPRGADDPGGVDLYVGGVEHAVLHLLYARFWHKVLHDLGHVSSSEPFRRLVNQGYIQAYAFTDSRGVYVPAEQVEETSEGTYWYDGRPVTRTYGKMGKSLRNVVTPDEMCERYGADTFRVYEMSMGPLDASRPWETRAVVGAYRFLQRLWRNLVDERTGRLTVVHEPWDDVDPGLQRLLHRTIHTVSHDYENLRANTAIARLIELNNALTKAARPVPRVVAEPLVQMTAPVAPHLAEELWSRLGHDTTVTCAPFPTADPAYLAEETVTCVVQVAGKLRDRIEVPPSVGEDELRNRVLALPSVVAALGERSVRTVVVRAPRLVNVVPA